MANPKKNKNNDNINIKNRQASFEYEFIDKFTAGLQLTGTEIKSVREGKVNLKDGFCFFRNGELFIKNMHISEYTLGTHYNHDPLRIRKLLLNKKELKKLESKVKERGYSIIPVSLFINDKGLAKMEITLAKGKKSFDKRDSIKEKDNKREVDRLLKYK